MIFKRVYIQCFLMSTAIFNRLGQLMIPANFFTLIFSSVLFGKHIKIFYKRFEKDIVKNYQSISNKSKTPLYLIQTDSDMETVDTAFKKIGKILKLANAESYSLNDDNKQGLKDTNLIFIGTNCIALLCFWLLMEAYNWDFKIYWQIPIYIGFIFLGFFALLFIGGILGKYVEKIDESESIVNNKFIVLAVIVPFGLLVLEASDGNIQSPNKLLELLVVNDVLWGQFYLSQSQAQGEWYRLRGLIRQAWEAIPQWQRGGLVCLRLAWHRPDKSELRWLHCAPSFGSGSSQAWEIGSVPPLCQSRPLQFHQIYGLQRCRKQSRTPAAIESGAQINSEGFNSFDLKGVPNFTIILYFNRKANDNDIDESNRFRKFQEFKLKT